jgi:hypothetical protein
MRNYLDVFHILALQAMSILSDVAQVLVHLKSPKAVPDYTRDDAMILSI